MSNPWAMCCISWSSFSVLVFKISSLWYLNFGCHAEYTAMATAVFIRTQVWNDAGQYFLQNLLENTINSLLAVHFPSSGLQMPYINVYCWIAIYILGRAELSCLQNHCGHLVLLFFPKWFVIVTLSKLYYMRFLNDQDICLVFTILFTNSYFSVGNSFHSRLFLTFLTQPPQKTKLCLPSTLKCLSTASTKPRHCQYRKDDQFYVVSLMMTLQSVKAKTDKHPKQPLWLPS